MSLYSSFDQRVLIPLADKLKGRDLHGAFEEALRTEWFSETQLQELQNQRLKRLITHCYNNVPYYRGVFDERNLTPDDIQTTDDLVKLPILTRQIVRDHYDELISKDVDKRTFKKGSTGGSTGTPMQYLEDFDTWNAFRGLRSRGWLWAGFNVGEKMYSLAGNSLVKKNTSGKTLLQQNLFDRVLMRNKKHDCTDISNEALERYYKSLMKYKPAAIRGYGSSLYFLARYIEQNDLPTCEVKVVFTTGEKLQLEYRNKLQEVFHAPVFDAYGASDGGVNAYECYMHEGLHIGEESCVLEIVDNNGNPLPYGEVGYVITTDLYNYAFPFLRYKVGDMAYIKKDLCSCGRKHRLLGEVIGREGRAIFNKQGRPFSSIIINHMMFQDLDNHTEKTCQTYEKKIDRYQIRQDKEGDITVLIKPVERDEPLSTFNYIKENFEKHFPDIKVTIEFVESIPTLASGKEDFCISEYEYKGDSK